jgi:hypothetical protein
MTVTKTDYGYRQNQDGTYVGFAVINVTGLSSATPSTIPHTLGSIPRMFSYTSLNGTAGQETSVPDATNFYYTTGSGQTTLRIEVTGY